jgi:hypothetical protein
MPPPAAGSACSVVSQDPGNGTTFPAGTYFDVVWTISNTTAEAWRADSSDYRFGGAVNGVGLHTGSDNYDFTYTVEPGATVSIVINMQAPSGAGTYGETWMITSGAVTICQFDFSVSVE